MNVIAIKKVTVIVTMITTEMELISSMIAEGDSGDECCWPD